MDKLFIDNIFDNCVEGCDLLFDFEVKDFVFVEVKKLSVFREKFDVILLEDWNKFFLEEFVENYVFKIWVDDVVLID